MRSLALLSFLFFSWVAPQPLLAAPGSPFSWETGVEILYDDNLLRYSDQDILNPMVADLIVEPYLLVQYKNFFTLRPTRIFADLSADFHADYSFKNYETYRLGIKQGLPGQTDFMVTYTLTPDYPITRTDGLRYETLNTEFRKLWGSRFMAGLGGRLGWKDYTQDRFDTDLWEGILRGSYRFRRVKIGGRYGYEEGKAAGSAITDPDYREGSFQLFTTFYAGNRQDLTLRFTQTDRDFTTPNPAYTRLHGRSDQYRTYAFRYNMKIHRRVEWRMGYEHTRREVSGIALQDIALLDYQENLYRVGLSTFW